MAKKKEETNKKKTPSTPAAEQKKDKKASRDANGRFTKGHAKEGGRTAGTKNKATSIRDKLKEQLQPTLDNLGAYLLIVKDQDGMSEMLKTAEKFMPYYLPKLSSMSLSADQDRPISEEQRLTELDALYTKKELSINFKSMTMVNNDKLRLSDPDNDEDDFDLSIFDTTDG